MAGSSLETVRQWATAHLPFTKPATPSSSRRQSVRPNLRRISLGGPLMAGSGSRNLSTVTVDDAQLVEIRAAQRTFEGAYVRTALGQFGFALVVLKIFTAEFYSVGALFAAYGAGVLAIALYRRHQGNSQFFLEFAEPADRAGDGGREDGGLGASVGAGAAGRGTVEEDAPVSRFRTSGNVVLGMTALSLAAYTTLLVLVIRLGRK